jgi:O-antigen/teichoic acid export membrane protein
MDFLRNRSAIYFLEKSVEIKEVGLYYFGLSVGMIMNAITSAFATSYSPRMFNLFREQPLELAKREYAKIFQYIFLLMNIACVVIGLFSEEFVLLFMPKYVRSYTIIPLITFSYFLGGVYLFFHNSFYWVKKTSLVSLSSFGMCVITIFAQVLLIPRHGIVGSAFGLFIGQVAGLMIGYLLSQKAFPMNYHFKAIILVSIISMISVFLISLWTPTEFSIWRFGLKLSALCTVFLMTIKKFKVTAKSVWPQVKAILKLLKSA